MKRKLINSFIILSSSTMITKLFSLMNRIILSRLLKEDGMALYILILPTLSLCITLAQLSIPSAVFRLISNPHYSNKKVMISASLICFFTCLIIMTSLFLFSPIIATHMLKENNALLPLLSLIIFIPLVGISGIIKNYYLGKEDVIHLAIANFIEETVRILFNVFFLSLFHTQKINILVTIALFSMSIGELSAIFYLLIKIKKKPIKINLSLTTLKNNFIYKDLMNIALPLTGSRFLHSLYNFIEPILLIRILTTIGINENRVQMEYAIITGYVINILVTPTFFNNVILRIIIPILNKDIAYNQKKDLQTHVLLSLFACFLISLPFTLIYYFFSEQCLLLLYNTNQGARYLKYMSIPFILFYLQTPLSATLQVLNKNKLMFLLSVIEIIIEFILLIILTPLYHTFTICIVMYIGLLTTLILSSFYVYQYIYK